MKLLLNKLKPHLISIIGFFAITFLLYNPQFTSNKQLDQHDILQGVGTNKQVREFAEVNNETVLWNPYVFSGMPYYLDGIRFSGDLLKYVQKIGNLGIPRPAHITFRLLIAFYFMLIMFGVRPWLAFAGAIAFGLNGFNIISIMAGHNMKIDAVSYMPLVLGAIHYTIHKKRILGSVLTALFLGLQIHTGHFQMTYYLLLIVLIYGIVYLIYYLKKGELIHYLKAIGFLVIAALLAVGSNAGKLMTTVEYSKYSTRGPSELRSSSVASESSGLDRSYAFQYSNGIFEPVFLFIPNALGGASNQSLDTDSSLGEALRRAGVGRQQLDQQLSSVPTYWGDQPLSAPYYAGMVAFFLFILGLFTLNKFEKYFIIAVVALGIILSYGSNFASFNYFMFDYFPGYNKFRSVTFSIILALIGIGLGGFLGLERLLSENDNKQRLKKLLLSTSVAGGFALLLILISGMFSYSGSIDSRLPELYLNALLQDRQSMLIADAFRAIIFVILAAGLIYAYLKELFNKKIVVGIFILLVFGDMFSLTRRYFNDDLFVRPAQATAIQETEANKYIKSRTGPGDRVFNLQNPFNETRTAYHHESLGGYHGAKLQRYQELIEYHLQSDLQSIISNLQSGNTDFSSAQATNMLNAKFLLAGNTRNAAIPNNYAYGNAWSVSNVIIVSSPDEEINSIDKYDLSNTAIIDNSKFSVNTENFSSANVKLTRKTPNSVNYTSTSSGNSFIVFSEIYYPEGWKAYVDGNETEIKRVNYVLRGLEVPAGSHEIEFVFEPGSYYTGNTIQLIFCLIILIITAGAVALEVRNSLKKSDNA